MATRVRHDRMAHAIESLLAAADQYVSAKAAVRQEIDRKLSTRPRTDIHRRHVQNGVKTEGGADRE